MLIWNIFTVLFGCLLAAISPDVWEQLIGKSKRAPLLSALLIAISACTFISFWSVVGKTICEIGTMKPTFLFGYTLLLAISISLSLLLCFGIVCSIINFLTKVLGQRLIDQQWQLTFSKGSLMGVMIFGFTSELSTHIGFNDIKPIFFFIPNFAFWLTLGACIWLLFIIGLTNSGPSRADKNYYTKKVKVAKAIIGATALLVFSFYAHSSWQKIGEGESKMITLLYKSYGTRDASAFIPLRKTPIPERSCIC